MAEDSLFLFDNRWASEQDGAPRLLTPRNTKHYQWGVAQTSTAAEAKQRTKLEDLPRELKVVRVVFAQTRAFTDAVR